MAKSQVIHRDISSLTRQPTVWRRTSLHSLPSPPPKQLPNHFDATALNREHNVQQGDKQLSPLRSFPPNTHTHTTAADKRQEDKLSSLPAVHLLRPLSDAVQRHSSSGSGDRVTVTCDMRRYGSCQEHLTCTKPPHIGPPVGFVAFQAERLKRSTFHTL